MQKFSIASVFASVLFYPTLLWNVLLCRVFGIWHRWDYISDDLILGGLPFRSDVRRLQDLGVRFVVNACSEYQGDMQLYQRCGIEQIRFPTIDYMSPELEDVQKAIAYIDSRRANGIVYLHCKAGRGRSATIALCWLIKNKNMAPRTAIEELIRCRRQVPRQLFERSVVQKFWAKCKHGDRPKSAEQSK
jgi:atypical dual specificity phosphatase